MMKFKKEIIIICIMAVVILAIMGTYAFFSTTVSSSPNALSANTAAFKISLAVTPEYFYKQLIPMDDELAVTGYNKGCIDDNNFEVCQAYTIQVGNASGTGQNARLDGKVKFNLKKIKNLSYMVLNQDGSVYQEATKITNGSSLSLGDFVELKDGETRDFVLLIWLSNVKNKNQMGDDANGTFTASVTYTGVRGEDLSSSITGVIN